MKDDLKKYFEGVPNNNWTIIGGIIPLLIALNYLVDLILKIKELFNC